MNTSDELSRVDTLIKHYTRGKRSVFARMIGMPQATVNTWFFRGAITANGREAILIAFPDVRREWLMEGRGDMLISSRGVVEVPDSDVIPLYDDIEATCGVLDTPLAIEYATDRLVLPGVKGFAAVRAKGDSMLPTVQSDDIVVLGYEVSLHDAHSGGVYMIVTTTKCMIKRVEMAGSSVPYIMALSDNHDYSPRVEMVDKRELLHLYPVMRVVRKV